MSIEAIAVIWGHWGHFRQLRSFKAIIEVKMHLKSSLQVGLIKSNHPNIQAFLSQNGTLEYILVIHIFVGLKSSWKNLLFFTRFTLGFNSKSHNFPPSKKRRSLPLHKSVQWQEERCVITYTHLFFWRGRKAPQAEKENGLYQNALPGRSKLKSFWIWTSSLLFITYNFNLCFLNFLHFYVLAWKFKLFFVFENRFLDNKNENSIWIFAPKITDKNETFSLFWDTVMWILSKCLIF